LNLRINRKIRAPQVRVIGPDGSQIGVLPLQDALAQAQAAGLDLVEISPSANPPVCKIVDYGKYRYDQTKREKESKKAQHQVKVKEIKLKPNIDEHDFQTKLKRAYHFLEKGNKVKVTCMFRGREAAHPELGYKVVKRLCEGVEQVGQVESPPKHLGRNLICVIAPGVVKATPKSKASAPPEKKEPEKMEKVHAKNEDK
jgi:translation initiation factor IF-3